MTPNHRTSSAALSRARNTVGTQLGTQTRSSALSKEVLSNIQTIRNTVGTQLGTQTSSSALSKEVLSNIHTTGFSSIQQGLVLFSRI